MKEVKKRVLPVLLGLSCGFLSGLLGGGGGMVVVPFLTFLMKKPTRIAHATAILIILPITAVGAVVYVASGYYSLGIALPVTLGVIGGGIFGALTLQKMSSKWLQKVFGIVMLVAGLRMIWG